jgi:hypothetical protein
MESQKLPAKSRPFWKERVPPMALAEASRNEAEASTSKIKSSSKKAIGE